MAHTHGENIVVNDGREALARLLGNDTGNWFVDYMKFGSGGHDPADPTIMKSVDVTDTDLYSVVGGGTPAHAGGEAYNFEFDVTSSTTWPSVGSRKVVFEGIVEATEGNDTGTLEYSEAGLYYNGGTAMFAHKAFGYIVKNNTIRLVATWTFTF